MDLLLGSNEEKKNAYIKVINELYAANRVAVTINITVNLSL